MRALLQESDPSLGEPQDTGSPVVEALPMFLMLAGVVMLIVVLMGNIKKKSRRRGKEEDLEPHERIEAIRQQANESRSVLDTRTAETAALVREMTALLDNRSEKLEILIQQADERITRLERLSQEAEQRLTPRHSETKSTPEPARPESTLASDALRQQIYDLADQGHATNEIAQRLGQHAGKVELILALRRA